MIDDRVIRAAVREYITTTLLHDPEYPLDDEEPLFTSGLIDESSLADLAWFVEQQFGIHIDEDEFLAEHVDNLREITMLVYSHAI
ncbi:MAG: hypothetical protein Kow0077_11670 [Anaerolineae bacterium]